MNKHLVNIGLAAAAAAAFVTVAIIADNNASAYQCDDDTVTVHSGDTLWSIATTYCTGSTQRAVFDIQSLHGTTSLHIGDTLTLP